MVRDKKKMEQYRKKWLQTTIFLPKNYNNREEKDSNGTEAQCRGWSRIDEEEQGGVVRRATMDESWSWRSPRAAAASVKGEMRQSMMLRCGVRLSAYRDKRIAGWRADQMDKT